MMKHFPSSILLICLALASFVQSQQGKHRHYSQQQQQQRHHISRYPLPDYDEYEQARNFGLDDKLDGDINGDNIMVESTVPLMDGAYAIVQPANAAASRLHRTLSGVNQLAVRGARNVQEATAGLERGIERVRAPTPHIPGQRNIVSAATHGAGRLLGKVTVDTGAFVSNSVRNTMNLGRSTRGAVKTALKETKNRLKFGRQPGVQIAQVVPAAAAAGQVIQQQVVAPIASYGQQAQAAAASAAASASSVVA